MYRGAAAGTTVAVVVPMGATVTGATEGIVVTAVAAGITMDTNPDTTRIATDTAVVAIATTGVAQ